MVSPFSNQCQWNPACSWHKKPTQPQRILFYSFKSTLYDISSAKCVWSRSYSCLISRGLQTLHSRVSFHPPAYRQFIINGCGFTLLRLAMGIGSASYSQSWPAAPRGWKPILNNRALIFNELLRNSIWATLRDQPVFFFIKQWWLHQYQLAPSSLPPMGSKHEGYSYSLCWFRARDRNFSHPAPPSLSRSHFLFANDVEIGNHFVFSVIMNIWRTPSGHVVVWWAWPWLLVKKKRHINVQAGLGWAIFAGLVM